MIATLITLLIVLLILILIYYAVSLFLPGNVLPIVGIILGIVFLLIALQKLGVLGVGQ